MSETKAIKAGLGYTIGNYLLKGFSFITVPIFARLLSTEDFGIYSIFVAYESFLFIIIGCAIHTSYKNAKYKFGLSGQARHSDLYFNYVSCTMAMLIINTAILLFIVHFFSEFFENVLKLNHICLILLILYSFSTAVLNCFNADTSLQYNYKLYITISGINAAGSLLCSVFLIIYVYSSEKYMGRIVGTVLPIFIIACCVCIYYLKRGYISNYKENIKWGLWFSIPIVFHGISQVILAQFDRIMINSMCGSVAAGIYSFGYTLFSIINVTFNSLDSVWSTWFYEKMSKGLKLIIKKYASIYIYGILVLCVVVMLVCPELIIILGSDKYNDAKYCAIPIIASGFFVFLYTLPASVEYYREKTKNIAGATIMAAIINIALNYVFIKRYGYIAAAYTTLFTYILYFVFHYYMAYRIEGENVFSNKTIIISTISLLFGLFVSIILLDTPFVRWLLALSVICIFIFYEERNYSFLRTISSIVKRRVR